MKTRIVMTFAFVFGIFAMVKAQSASSGVYETSQDFINQKMVYASTSTAITVNESSNADHITVVYNKQSHNLKKNDVFGYTDSNNQTYRFVGNSRYLILNPSEETLLYQHETKSANGVVMHYYFSRGAGDVQELTLVNVKNAFPNDLAFHEGLDAEFRSDAELASYELLPVLAAILPVSEESQSWVSKTSEVDGSH
jgi:hypothetical protein